MPNTGAPRGQYITTRSPIQRFCRKVHIPADSSQCWIWTGARFHYGHGAFAPDGRVPRNIGAHRWLYQWVHGVELPQNITVNHHCDNPPCVNPQHLYAGTQQDNVADMIRRGRQAQGTQTAAARLSEADVRTIRSSSQTVRQLARQFGVTDWTIYKVLQGKSYRNVL